MTVMAGGLPCLAPAQTFPSGNSQGGALSGSADSQPPLAILKDFNSTQASRDAAALQLIARRDDDAKSAVLDLFRSGPDKSKLALARALGDISWPVPDFQQPLMDLFGLRDVAYGAAAATALAHYHDDPAVLRILIDQARVGQLDVRIPAIRALGSFGTRLAADTLLDLLEHDDNGTDATREAASDALIQMTGRSDLGHNAQLWQQWRDSIKSDQQFDDVIQKGRAAAYEDELPRHGVFEKATRELLRNAFIDTPPDKRASVLLGYLQSPAPEIRALGADLVLQSASQGEVPPGAIQQTRLLLADTSSDVRAAAASALSADIDSANDLVTQLKRETDDLVRVRILRSLARFHDRAAIEEMLDLVGAGQSDAVRAAAADGIRDGAVIVINPDPALKAKTIDRLKVALVGTDPPDKKQLRRAITGALAQIKDQQLSEVFQPLLLPAEDHIVRANALIGLGNLPDPSHYGSQIDTMFEDPDKTLRLAAAQALLHVPPQAYIGTMLTHMGSDPDDQVRAEAWNVLYEWASAPDADEQNLTAIADGLKSDPAKELVIRQLLCKRLDADAHNSSLGEDARKKAEQLAVQEQNVGDLAMKPEVSQPGLAVDAYKSALDYWKANNGQVDVINRLCVQLVKAYLAEKHWQDAANFASQVVKDYQNDPNMRSIPSQVANEFQYEIAKLRPSTDATAYTDAMNLFDAIQKMNPPFPGSYPAVFQQKQKEMQDEHTSMNRPGT
jgi:HEAT repeat protein